MRSYYWLPIVVLASTGSVALADDARPAKGSPEAVVAKSIELLAGDQRRELAVDELDAIVGGQPPKKPGNTQRSCNIQTPSGVCKG